MYHFVHCLKFLVCSLIFSAVVDVALADTYDETFQKYVTDDGSIIVPDNYRTEFVFLGTFTVIDKKKSGSNVDMHQVYMDYDSVKYYRDNKEFPDGAIIVKELQHSRALDMTTGHVMSWSKGAGWFVMIKDTKGRFSGHQLWGNGWGWALFDVSDRAIPTTNDYKSECIPCHIPVKDIDWVHVWAYPLLNAEHLFSRYKN